MYFPDEVFQVFEKTGNNRLELFGTVVEPSQIHNDYSYVHEAVKKWDTLRICTMADNNMCAAVYDDCYYAYQNGACKDDLEFAYKDSGHIIDLNVTKSGSSVVIFDNNAYSYCGTPSEFNRFISECNRKAQIVYSATFNDKGEYCIVSDECFYYSDGLKSFLHKAIGKYGYFRYVFISELGQIAICERGIYFENIPNNVAQQLGEIHFRPDYVKFNDSGNYCISNKDGSARYRL